MTTIGIIGNGVVGHATARVWMEHTEVRIHDKERAKSQFILLSTIDTDLVFVCLPERELDGFFDSLQENPEFRNQNYVIKSTVPVGTTRQLLKKYKLINVCHSPEFLTQRCAVADAFVPSRNIIGSPITMNGQGNGAGGAVAF